jgi:hypothetical protein
MLWAMPMDDNQAALTLVVLFLDSIARRINPIGVEPQLGLADRAVPSP